MAKYIVYGINNCDKVKKFRKELTERGVDFDFYDFKKQAPTSTLIKNWKKFHGELPVNKRGTTYRKFKDEFEALSEADKVNFLTENSSMLMRPVVEESKTVLMVGLDKEVAASLS